MQIEKRNITSLALDGTYIDMRKKSIQNMIDGKWDLTNHIKEETYIKFDENLDFFLLKGQDIVLFFNDTKSRDELL
ncbi:MAG: hypothetical protein Q8K30_06930 [Candidatus Gracilibacteria bacterium]|nr:hypothetical protein [Candidatus Gracilibacteria bacterium]